MADSATAPALSPSVIEQPCSKDRWIELLLVLLVAFAPPIITSTHAMLFGIKDLQDGNYRYVYVCLQQIGALALVWYVLRRRGSTFSSLGFRVTVKGGFLGMGLAFLAIVASGLALLVVELIHKHYFGSYVIRPNPALLIPKASLAIFIPFLVVNCFFEEAIVRAYLMTEVLQMTGSTALAVMLSVLIQASYHTYQGWLNTAGLSAGFLLFSLYYARSKKFFPLYVGHLAMDSLAALYLFSR